MASSFYAIYSGATGGGGGGGGGSGANKTLSNLTAPTAINQSLLAGVDNAVDVGSATNRFGSGNFGTRVNVGIYPPASGQGLVSLFDGSFPGIEFYSGGSNAWIWATDGNGLYTQNVGSGIKGMTVVEGHAQFNDTTGTAMLTVDATTGTTVTSPFIVLQDGTQGTAGQVWTSIDASGTGSWAPAAAGGANTSLSNLSAVSINTNLSFGASAGANPTINAASATTGLRAPGLNLVGGAVTGANTTISGSVVIKSGPTTSSNGGSASGTVQMISGTSSNGNTGAAFVQTGGATAANKSSGFITVSTGGATGTGSSNSGLLNLSTGSSSNGSSGPINLNTGTGNGTRSGDINVTTGDGLVNSGGVIFQTGNAGNPGGTSGGYSFQTGSADAGTGGFNILTGGPGSSGTSGAIVLATGAAPPGLNSGDLTLITGATSGGGTTGRIQLQNGTQGTIGHVWTSTDVNGSGAWMPGAATGKVVYQQDTPLTGDTVTIADGVAQEVLTPAGTLATLTLNLPTSPLDGQKVGIACTQVVTTLTLSGGSNTVSGGLSAFTADGFATYIYILATTTWYRVG